MKFIAKKKEMEGLKFFAIFKEKKYLLAKKIIKIKQKKQLI
jgi:hypothetical protein